MAGKQGIIAITVEPASLRGLISTLNKLDKETQNQVRDAAYPLSQRLAGQLTQFAGSSPTPQTALVAQSIIAKRDRLVRVDVGGSKKVGRKYGGEQSKSGKGAKVRQVRAPAGALLWGSEYGSKSGVDSIGRAYTKRFGAGHSSSGFWIAPAVDYYTPILAAEYIEIVKRIIKREGLE